MSLAKQWFVILFLTITLGASIAWSQLAGNDVAAATPTPASTSTSAEISNTPSPDGRWTAVVNNTTGSLDLRQQPDSQTVNIFPPGSTVNNITWSPDSGTLLVVRTNWVFNQPEGTGVSSNRPIAIWQVELKEGKAQPAQKIFESPTPAGPDAAEQIQFGHWSPNSRYVLFWLGPLGASILADGLPLWVLDVATGQATQVAEAALLNPRYQSWAPNSSALAVTAGAGREAQANKWLNLWETTTGQATTVISQTEQIPGIVAWSPKGDLIAYAAVSATVTAGDSAHIASFDNPLIAGRRVYVLDPATGQSHRLNQGKTFQDAPLWSDDGSVLYYAERVGSFIQLMAADPTTGQAQAVPGTAIPLPDYVGYYGQSDLEELLARRPGGELAATPAPAKQPTATPPPASAADLELVRFIFKNHPPVLSTLTKDFLKTVEAGIYRDFSVQSVELTGDKTPEILVNGRADTSYLFVAVLSRDSAGKLHELFFTDRIEGKYLAEVQARVEGQRVIADFLTATGGAGYLETTWEQRWIECQPDECKLVWSAPLLTANRNAQWTMARRYAVAEIEQPVTNTLRLTTHRFGLIELPWAGAGAPPGSARRVVGPDTQAVYRREGPGQVYQLESQAQLTPGQEIAREFDRQNEETRQLVYETISQPFYQADGTFDNDGFLNMQAELWGLPAPGQPDDPAWGASYRQPDIAAHSGSPDRLGEWVAGVVGALDRPECRLTAFQHAAGKFTQVGRLDLPCTANFTHLAWVELTGDSQEELLLLTIPPDTDLAGQVERLYVYSIAGNELTKLTTLDGYINGADGAGIRWEETPEGIKVKAGLPLLDPDGNPALNDLHLERKFQTYIWDNESNDFKRTG